MLNLLSVAPLLPCDKRLETVAPVMHKPKPDFHAVRVNVTQALSEDVGSGDITAELIPADTQVTAQILAREAGILCGSEWADEVFRQLDGGIRIDWQQRDGDAFASDTVLAKLQGAARAIMTGERCALNFLQTLSAVATTTRQLVKQVAHTQVRLLDTRKTIPGLRVAQKYAVAIGGGQNHRMGLYDAFLIKENHIAACGGIAEAIATARRQQPAKPIEIEVQSLQQLDQAIGAGADIVMLDNFTIDAIHEAVEASAGRCKLEASGGIDSSTLVSVAETGVDYISVGAITKHCRAIDLSLLLA